MEHQCYVTGHPLCADLGTVPACSHSIFSRAWEVGSAVLPSFVDGEMGLRGTSLSMHPELGAGHPEPTNWTWT